MTTEPKILTDEQIDAAQEAAYRALVDKGYNGGMDGYQWDRASARAIEQAVLQSPQVQRWKKDAGRFRFLTAHCRVISEHWGGRWSIVIDGPAPESQDSEDDIDTAIDAAMEAKDE